MDNDAIQWNLDRAWEHIAAVVKAVNEDPARSRVFEKKLEKVAVDFSELKGMYLDLLTPKGDQT